MEIPKLNLSPVEFVDSDHTYWLNGKQLKGVTSTLVRRAYPDTYPIPEGMTEQQWRAMLTRAAANGTFVHQAIELYEDLGAENDLPELRNYIDVKESNNFVNVATEYIVSDEENYASKVDHVWSTLDGDIILVDIKHTYSIHEPEVTCQLSIYKRFFEKQNPHLKVSGIALLWLRGDKVEFRLLRPLPDEVLDTLIDADLKDISFDIQQHYGELPVKFADAEEQIARLSLELKEKKALYDKLTSGLFELMNEYSVKKFTGSRIQLTITNPSRREVFDKESFKEDHPDLYDEYKTYTDIRPSLRITLKK